MGRWHIWLRFYDWNGRVVGHDKHPDSYENKYTAEYMAKKLWGSDPPFINWMVGITNPFLDDTKGRRRR